VFIDAKRAKRKAVNIPNRSRPIALTSPHRCSLLQVAINQEDIASSDRSFMVCLLVLPAHTRRELASSKPTKMKQGRARTRTPRRMRKADFGLVSNSKEHGPA